MKAIIAGNIETDIALNLEKIGFELMYTKPCGSLLKGLEYHPDMQLAVIDKKAFCSPFAYDNYKEFILSAGYTAVIGKSELSSNYPNDIAYNISVVSNYVFHNIKYTDCEIKNAVCDKAFVNVNQGYSGCSICNVGKDALITADMSIYKSSQSLGIDALLISPGNIFLDGFDYGFIGGASFCCNDTLYFFGKITEHPDYLKINFFCKKHGFGICELSDSILSDYGSLIILD